MFNEIPSCIHYYYIIILMAMIQEEPKLHLEVDKIFKCKQNIFF